LILVFISDFGLVTSDFGSILGKQIKKPLFHTFFYVSNSNLLMALRRNYRFGIIGK